MFVEVSTVKVNDLFVCTSALISIETVKVTSSQHRFYFDVHKVWETWTG